MDVRVRGSWIEQRVEKSQWKKRKNYETATRISPSHEKEEKENKNQKRRRKNKRGRTMSMYDKVREPWSRLVKI